MQRLRNRGNKGDGPPMFSYEFIIQNHADIISCVCMVIFMLLIPQVRGNQCIVLEYNQSLPSGHQFLCL